MAASGSRDVPDYIVWPQGIHMATIVWLHDKHETYLESMQFVASLKLKHTKWVCPPVEYTNTSYDFGPNIKQDDRKALDSVANRVAYLLSCESTNAYRGVGGVGMGATVALQFAADCALNNIYFEIRPRVVFGIMGWLSIAGSIKRSIKSTYLAASRAASLQTSILLTEGTNDHVAPYASGEEVAMSLREDGFEDVLFVPFKKIETKGPVIFLSNWAAVKDWLEDKLSLKS